jgi:4-hydroxybenzoate-CoA ligase
VSEPFLERRPYNAAADFVDANIARGHSGKPAFIDPQRSITYGELQQQTCRFASGLLALGLKAEDRVALLLSDTIDFPVAFWGAVRAGIVAIPLNTWLKPEQYAFILADSRVSAVIADATLVAVLRDAIAATPSLRHVILAGDNAKGQPTLAGRTPVPFDAVCRMGRDDVFAAPTLSDEVAFWLYTSGSTGEPKGVKHVHSSLRATASLMGQGILGIGPDDVVLSAAKLFFAYGLGNAMTFPMSVGATAILLPERPTPDAIFALMRQHRPTIFYAVPSLYTALLAHDAMSRGAGSDRLRLCVSAGEALPAQIGERWREVAGVDVLDGIGSTEMLQTFLSNRPGDVRYGSTGKAVPGYDVKIVDESGAELPPGDIGELIVRGPSAGEGYWNQRRKSRRTFAGEWTFTGDKYYRDENGYYFYCGRTDDMFKVSGMWVSPFDVEAALVSHEAVLEAAVIPKEDSDGLIKPKAFVVLKNGHADDEAVVHALKEHVKTHAGTWKYPRWIELRSDLPRTATGKVQRYKLREEEESRREAEGYGART